MKKKTVLNLTALVIFSTIIFLSIGFAAFSSTQKIISSAVVKSNIQVRIQSNVTKLASPDTIVSYNEFAINKISNGITLPYSDSYAILDIGILNIGNTKLGIKSILGLDSKLKYEFVNDDYLSQGYKHYAEKEILCDDSNTQKCELGAESHVLLKISYKDLDSYNSAASKTFDTNLTFTFGKVYKVNYGKKVLSLLKETPVYYAMENEDFNIPINYSDVDHVTINSSYKLDKNVDYFLANEVLTIKNVKDNLSIGLNFDTNGGLTIASNWISDNSVEITLNGKNSVQLFIRLRDGDLYIATTANDLIDTTYNAFPLFVSTDNIYQEFEYLDGTCSLTGAITIKFRDTTNSCAAKDVAQFIANNVGNMSKNNFTVYDTYVKSGPVTAGVDLSQLSFYTAANNTFNNYKFRITYGKV